MKVLITNIKDKKEKSGVGKFVNDIYSVAKANGLKIKVMLPRGYAAAYNVESGDVVSVYHPKNRYVRWIWYLVAMPILSKNFDIVHFSSEDLPIITLRIWNWFFRRNQKIVVTVHDLGEFKSARYSRGKDLVRRLIVPLEIRLADLIFVVSNETAKDVQTFVGVPQDDIVLLNNPVLLKTPSVNGEASRQYVREKFGITTEYFLFVSQLNHPSKNHVRLIEAFELICERGNKATLVLVGGKAYGSSIVLERINTSPVKSRIFYLGYLPDQEVEQVFNACDIYIFPSLMEGFGRGALEAWHYKKPLVCSHGGSLREVVGNAGYLFDPSSIEDIADAVQIVHQNETLQKELVELGTERLKEYCPEFIFEQLRGGYSKVMVKDLKQ